MLDEATIETFQGSFRRCQTASGFFALFYDKFLATSPEVAAHFRNTDLRKQSMVIQASFQMMLLAAMKNGAATTYLHNIAERHSRQQLNIRPALYDLWLQSLLATVAETDVEFDQRVEDAWMAVLEPGIAYMKSRYESPAG
ncbi:MAG: globin [Verrucomicrobia bacterium]|nr:globin [Verrucomicrobiota bacterium]